MDGIYFILLFDFTNFIDFRLAFVRLRIKAGEEGEDDARSACPFDTLGCTLDTMATTTGRDGETLS